MSCSNEFCAPDRAALLRLARVAIRDAVASENELPGILERTAISPAMQTPRGVFVTLMSGARPGKAKLRGCIGNMNSSLPLYRNLVQTAPRAALDDPRFPGLRTDEIDEVRIEISALTELANLERVEDLSLGTDGVQLEFEGKRAVFLPQVAHEQRWDTRQFLEQLAVKAGLTQEGWKQAELSVFQVEKFSESDPPETPGQAGFAAGG